MTLTAERIGNGVQLHWSTPEQTTDGLDVRGQMAAAICRRAVGPTGSTCLPIVRLPVVAGASEAVDELPATLTAGPTIAMEYRVEIRNNRGHSAGMSEAAFAAGGSAPPALQGLQATASAEGAMLTWQPEDGRDAVELHRTTSSTAKNSATKTSPDKTSPNPTLGKSKTEATDVVLRVPPGDGALDRTAQMGTSYRYAAQRVRTVTVESHTFEVRSAVSAPVTVEMRDVFPPRRPSGLEGVAGNSVVDLSWEPNTEPDLAGYIVRREEYALAKLLNTSPVPQPSFQDKTAAPRHTYRYTVVAVDRVGNRSPASEPAQVYVRPEVP